MSGNFPTIQQWKRQQLMLTHHAGKVDCPDCCGVGCKVCGGGRLSLHLAFECAGYQTHTGAELKKYAAEVIELLREQGEQTGKPFTKIIKPFLMYCAERHIQVDIHDQAYVQALHWVPGAGAFSQAQLMAVCDIRIHRARSILKRLLSAELIKPVAAGDGFFIAVRQ